MEEISKIKIYHKVHIKFIKLPCKVQCMLTKANHPNWRSQLRTVFCGLTIYISRFTYSWKVGSICLSLKLCFRWKIVPMRFLITIMKKNQVQIIMNYHLEMW